MITITITDGNLTQCNGVTLNTKPNGSRYVVTNVRTGIIESGKVNRSISFTAIHGSTEQPADGNYTIDLDAKPQNITATATRRTRSVTYNTTTATESLAEILKNGFENLTTADCSAAIVYCDRIVATLNKEKENEKTLIAKVQTIRNNLLEKKTEIEKQAEIARNNEIEKASALLDALLA